MITGFETDVLRCEVLTDGNSYFYHEVGLGYDNDHEMSRKFETQEEAEKFYYYIKELLKSNNVEIYED